MAIHGTQLPVHRHEALWREAKLYVAMQILEAAVKHAGSFDPHIVRNALTSIDVETIMGRWKADAAGYAQ